MITLDNRLLACVGLVSGTGIVCDVGTDHAYLPAYLIQSGKCQKAIAGDIADGPLDAAKATIEKHGLSDVITIIKSDGLKNISKDGITDVVIAGMGAEAIMGIIAGADWVKDENVSLILQPMTRVPLLRRWLYENGYQIITETAALTDRPYTAIKASYCGQSASLTDFEAYAGKLNINLYESKIYISGVVDRLEREGNGLLHGNKNHAEGINKIKLANQLKEICEGV